MTETTIRDGRNALGREVGSLGNLVIDADSDGERFTALVYFRAGVGWVVDCDSCACGAWHYQRSGAVAAARRHLTIVHDAY